MLERMRALKTPAELEKLRTASELITDSMLATIAGAREGSTKAEIIENLRREETNRGLHFRILPADAGCEPQPRRLGAGLEKGRSAVDRFWRQFHGYIGDLCRMGVLGEPDAELEDLLAEVEQVQQAAFSKIRAGALGGDVIAMRKRAEGLHVTPPHGLLRPRHRSDHP